jgi:hypothetical protein
MILLVKNDVGFDPQWWPSLSFHLLLVITISQTAAQISNNNKRIQAPYKP